MAREVEGRPVLVASLMRTGTHVLIDLILNNLQVYRQSPLYVQVDEYLTAGLPLEDLLTAGPYVLKTHVPQLYDDPERLAQMRRVAAGAVVVIPRREVEATRYALARFGQDGRGAADRVEEDFERLCEFYGPFGPHFFDFNQLVRREHAGSVVRRLSRILDQPLDGLPVATPDLRRLGRILLDKALTRSLGAAAPRINTTIRIGKVPRRGHTAKSVAGMAGAASTPLH
ncbi:MAG: hypothetical protein ACKV19_13685 [Verrucomicrobiales bacterium]